jgi:hypothetical protein
MRNEKAACVVRKEKNVRKMTGTKNLLFAS